MNTPCLEPRGVAWSVGFPRGPRQSSGAMVRRPRRHRSGPRETSTQDGRLGASACQLYSMRLEEVRMGCHHQIHLPPFEAALRSFRSSESIRAQSFPPCQIDLVHRAKRILFLHSRIVPG